jgi:uncharacterized protein
LAGKKHAQTYLAKHHRLQRLLRPLTAVGRMALSNYITQTVVCVLLFEGWGWGQFAQGDYRT